MLIWCRKLFSTFLSLCKLNIRNATLVYSRAHTHTYTHMYKQIYTYIRIPIYIGTRTYTHVLTYTPTHIPIKTYLYTYTLTNGCKKTPTSTHIYARIHIHTNIHVHTHTCTHMNTYTVIHTHIYACTHINKKCIRTYIHTYMSLYCFSRLFIANRLKVRTIWIVNSLQECEECALTMRNVTRSQFQLTPRRTVGVAQNTVSI